MILVFEENKEKMIKKGFKYVQDIKIEGKNGCIFTKNDSLKFQLNDIEYFKVDKLHM